MHELLTEVASLAVDRLQGVQALAAAPLGLWWWILGSSTGSAVVAHGRSCSMACGILTDQGSNLCLLHWYADSLPLNPQGSPVLDLIELYIWPIMSGHLIINFT